MIIFNGKEKAEQLLADLKEKILLNNYQIKFAIIQVGDVFESNKYISFKLKKATEIGIKAIHIKVANTISFKEIKNLILETQKKVDGLIIQLPLPLHLDKQQVLSLVDSQKDIDGLSELNYKNFLENKDFFFIPATAKAIFRVIKESKIKIENSKIYVIGESKLVGYPLKILLQRHGAIVKSFNKESGIKGSEEADMLIVAAGSPNLVSSKNIKKNAYVIDVGISTLDNHKIIGDVDRKSIENKAYFLSPSPGGVGPLTIVSLLENLVLAYMRAKKLI